jgi:hypothetical protein
MRQLLRPDQTSQFDAAVVKALTDGQGEHRLDRIV